MICELFPADKNRIKTMNEVAFVNLPQLTIIDLQLNYCINYKFDINPDSKGFRKKISKKCKSADA